MSEHAPEAPSAADPAETFRLVITPGGMRPADQVTLVEPDVPVRPARRRRRRPTDLWKSVFLGGAVRGNWIVATYRESGAIEEMIADIVVPGEPVQRGPQLLYVFIGLQDESSSQILQPVVQWGAPGDPAGWNLCSWFVDNAVAQANPTPSVPVAAGARVRARIRLTARRGNRFDYVCGFDGHPRTQRVLHSSRPLRTAVAVLEAYGIRGDGDYPPNPAIRFDQVRLTPSGTSSWKKQDLVIDAGQHAEIVDGTEPCVFDLHCRR